MALQFPLIQGVAHDHSSVDFKLDGISYIGLKSVDWDDGQEGGEIRGTHPQKIADTRGQYKASLSFELYEEYGDDFESAIMTSHPDLGLYDIHFPAELNIVAEGGTKKKYDFVGTKIQKVSGGSSSGNDGISRKYECSVFYILRNGRAPVTGIRK